jgi:hypothetical protein
MNKNEDDTKENLTGSKQGAFWELVAVAGMRQRPTHLKEVMRKIPKRNMGTGMTSGWLSSPMPLSHL